MPASTRISGRETNTRAQFCVRQRGRFQRTERRTSYGFTSYASLGLSSQKVAHIGNEQYEDHLHEQDDEAQATTIGMVNVTTKPRRANALSIPKRKSPKKVEVGTANKVLSQFSCLPRRALVRCCSDLLNESTLACFASSLVGDVTLERRGDGVPALSGAAGCSLDTCAAHQGVAILPGVERDCG